MVNGQDGAIRVGALLLSPDQLRQIETWVDDFSAIKVRIDMVNEIGLDRYDVYFVAIDADTNSNEDGSNQDSENERTKTLSAFVAQAASTPCLALATRDDEALVKAAEAAGMADFLVMTKIDSARLERAVRFSMRGRQRMEAMMAREMCLSAARERDRLWLANMLHDGPLQDLIGARFLLSALGSGGTFDEIQSSLQAVIQSVRTLCSDLKPPALGPFGLEKAIRAYIQTFQTRQPKITTTLELDVDKQQLPEWARLALFRVLQAAVSNVASHAQASQLGIRLLLDEGQVRLTVADDGQGFEVPSSWLDFARTERYGLLTMQERVDALQGRMMVQSTAGSGTRVLVQVPLDQPPLPLPAFLLSPLSATMGSDSTGHTAQAT